MSPFFISIDASWSVAPAAVRDAGFPSMSTAGDFSDAEFDNGRRLFAGEWSFLTAANSIGSLPRPDGLEVAFAGRSNVGKSSLINALTGRRALARISKTPGRTQELIFFAGPNRLVLVDLPGYGYAAAAKSKVKAWTRLIHDYLHGRAALARVYVSSCDDHAVLFGILADNFLLVLGRILLVFG